LVLLAVVTVAPAASAKDDNDGRVSWSVQPADGSAPDSRSWVEQTLDPGASAEEHLAIRNYGSQPVTFRISAADGYFTPTGRFNMLPSTQRSVAAGTWISVVDSVSVQPGKTAIVPFTTTVPRDAEPGDHAAGIAASVLSTSVSGDGANVGVESRVGFRVMTRVTGELVPSAALTRASGSYRLTWNPLRPGVAEVVVDVENNGNARLNVQGTVDIAGRSAEIVDADAGPQELLPGDRRRFTVTVSDVWPLFALPAKVSLAPTVVALEGKQSTMTPVTSSTLVWAIPWPQLASLLGMALLVASLAWRRRLRRRGLRDMLAQAREEGRRSVGQPSVDA